MSAFQPMREFPKSADYKPGDVLVVFGELFSRGYANGIVDEAKKRGMHVIYSTVGRRDEQGALRPLNSEELSEKEQPLINIPLEAGFDLEPSAKGRTPVDQLKGIKLSAWDRVKLDWDEVEQSRKAGIENFRQRVKDYVTQLSAQIPDGANVLFVHTMAGGFPRAKVVMPAANRVFKGFGERFTSSEMFWNTDIGKFCEISFNEVTGETLCHLVDLTSELRDKIEKRGNQVSYVAYGYHGNDILMGEEYRWQSYSPYLQGFAKLTLEKNAELAWKQGVKASVFNVPEILTNSSSIFLGVEVALYPLMGALRKEGANKPQVKALLDKCSTLLKDGHSLDEIMQFTKKYFESEIIQKWSSFKDWPQHNGPEQMALMRESSAHIIGLHKNEKQLMTQELSEVVFTSCGQIMLDESWNPKHPVWWIGHDMVAQRFCS